MPKQIINDRSYGVIPIRQRDGVLEFLLIQHRGSRHWSFPKGHKEGTESDLAAAQRELAEEVGILTVKIFDQHRFLERYSWKSRGHRHHKVVTFYVGIVRQHRLRLQREEIRRSQWASFEQALQILTFPETKRLLQRAHDSVQPSVKKPGNATVWH